MSRYLADNDTAENQIYGTHYDNFGRDPTQRAIDFGMYSGDSAGENIDASRFTADEVFNSWKNSPGHDAIMLFDNPPTIDITRFGIGVAYNANSRYKIYWTMDIATSRSNQFNQLTTVSSDCSFSPPAPPVNQSPVGTTDSITNSSCRVQGWAYDPDTPSANVAIHVYRDGQAGSGAAGKSTYTANIPREPAVGNHGFDITFDPSGDAFDQGFFDGATHTIYVYAIDTAGGTNPLLGMTNNISRNITCSPPPSLPPHSKGDVNCDNKITSVDSLLILKTVAGIPVTNTACAGGGIDEVTAHVDADSDIDAVDALRVLQHVALIRQIGSASFNSGFTDSDGDQIADSQEAQYPCMNPNVADANGDYDGDSIAGIVSMTNISEFAIGTNPCIADIDGDGYKDGAEFWIGTNARQRCGTDAWPSDFNNDKKVTLQDLTSFSAPIARLNTSIGSPNYNRRWDLIPGKGAFPNDINISDLTSLIGGTTGFPPMFGGTIKAFNGPSCTPN